VSRLPEISCLLVRVVEHTISREAAISYVNRRDPSGATTFDLAVAGKFLSSESDCLMNTLGSAAEKRRQLFYLLDLIGP
jgi:hypothetical protein